MRRAALLLLLVGCSGEREPIPSYQSELEGHCKIVSEFASRVMAARQSELTFEAALQRAYDADAISRGVMTSVVRDAYTWPLMDGDDSKRRAAENYAEETFQMCAKSPGISQTQS